MRSPEDQVLIEELIEELRHANKRATVARRSLAGVLARQESILGRERAENVTLRQRAQWARDELQKVLGQLGWQRGGVA